MSWGISAASNAQNSFTSCNALTGGAGLIADCRALVALYDDAFGGTWANEINNTETWKQSDDLNDWYGVTVSTGRVTKVELGSNSLSGTIPDLSALTSLEDLDLGSNSLSGMIPDLSALTSLQRLYLDGNDLSGTIPALSALTELTHLHLYNNSLSGTIPDGIRNLTKLRTLFLHNNSLSGTIPALSTLTDLEILYLQNNSLGGTIPALSALTKLQTLYLFKNNLSGSIPDLGALTKLKYLHLNNNSLGGPITASYFPASLQSLSLHRNSLSGTIPDLSGLNELLWLYLNNNSLSGTISASPLPFPTSLTELGLSNNNLSGEIPDLSDLTQLQWLYLHNNSLSGEIPDLSALTDLSELYLHDNKLTGSGNDLSPDLGQLTSLKELAIWGNDAPTGDVNLASTVTSSVIDRAALRLLHDANGGPGWKKRTGWRDSDFLGTWHGVTTENLDGSGRVTELDLSGNGLTGDISNSLEALSGLTSLDLSNNKPLGGTLSERLKDISGLAALDIGCTAISTPSSPDFNRWLRDLAPRFQLGCPSAAPLPPPSASAAPPPPPPPPPAPEPPTPISPDGSVLIAETEDDVFAFTPVGEGGRVIYGEKTIDFTVTGNDDLSPNPTIILSRAALDAIADAGGSVTFDVSTDLSEDPPSGFRLGGHAADIGFGVELEAGETVGMCLPTDVGVEGPVVHYYDEDSGMWEPLAEQETSVLNGVRSVCGKTGAFPRFGLFVAEEDPVPPPAAQESGGGCAVAGVGSGSAIPPADLFLAALLLLGAVVSRFRGTAPSPDVFASPREIRPYSRAVTGKFPTSLTALELKRLF